MTLGSKLAWKRALTQQAAFLPVALVLAVSCGRCEEAKVAKLVITLERVERDYKSGVGRWQRAQTGASFAVGDGLRTFAGSRAELALSPAGRLQVEQDTTVRFADRVAGAPQRLSIERGSVEVEAGGVEIELRTADAVARIERNTRVRIHRNAAATRFDVRVGQVRVERGSERRELGAGDAFELQVGVPLIEPAAAVAHGAQPAVDAGNVAPADAGLPEVKSADGQAALRFDAIAGRPELSVAAGENAIIHHPSPPLRVTVSYGGCPGELAVEALGAADGAGVEQRVRGRGSALLRLGQGAYRYRVLCIVAGQLAPTPAVAGSLRVRADAATRALATGAPQAVVDADGRRYTVHYQNLLPAVTLRWPNAPSAPSYLLHIEPEHGAPRTQSTAAPIASLPPGAFGDGASRFSFQAGTAHSPQGSLVIAFDPSGRTASLSAPADRGFAAGGSAQVSGIALAGSAVSVGGAALAVDGKGRFSAQTTVPAGAEALAVRVQHPAAGIHYYLRRASQAAGR